MFEKEIEQKLRKEQKEKERREKRRRHRTPVYKGQPLRNWLVYPLGVISVEMQLAEERKYNALEFTEQKAIEVINKYLVKICEYDKETGELSFCMGWHRPWEYHADRKDKLWCRKFNYELTYYLRDTYECEGFKKSIEDDMSEWITFTKI